MDRYSIINGTTLAGPYDRMGMSQGLPQFLSRIGANSMNFVLSKVESLLCGFEKLEGYEAQPTDDKPLAIRYAPMHLYRLPELPNNMEPFCALSVSGPENRTGGRDSVYSQTFYLSRAAMHEKTEGFTFLDQIFGTTLITSREMDGHRDGRAPIDLDAEPAHAAVEMLPQDRAVVLKVVHAIYNKKLVVLRLEKGCCFNRRSLTLLKQIYSMMQPRLATEIGFASYHNPAAIANLSNLTSTRIFVIPQEVPLDRVTLSDYTLVDLNNPESCKLPESDELLKQLQRWHKLPVEDRQEALAFLFDDDTLDYTNKEKFLEISGSFWTDPVFAWLKEMPEKGTMTTLVDVLKRKQSFPLCRISWIGKMFDSRINLLLKDTTLEQLTAEAVCEFAFGEKNGKKKYLAGKQLLPEGSDVTIASALLTKKAAETDSDRRYAQALAAKEAEIAKLQKEMAAAVETHQAEQKRLQEALKTKLEEVNNYYKNLLAEQDDAHAAEKAQLTAQHQAELAALQQQMQEAKAAADEAFRAKCAEYDLKLAQLREEYAQMTAQKDGIIAQKEQELSQAQAEFAANLESAKAQAQQLLTAERKKVTDAQTEAQAARQEAQQIQTEAQRQVEDAQAKMQALERELAETKRLSGTDPAKLKKEKLLGIIAGAVAGALLVGIVWLTTSLLGGGKKDPNTDLPQRPPVTNTTEGSGTQTPTGDTVPGEGTAPTGDSGAQ